MEVLAKFKTFLQDYGLEATLRAFEKEVAGIAKIHMDSQTSKSYTSKPIAFFFFTNLRSTEFPFEEEQKFCREAGGSGSLWFGQFEYLQGKKRKWLIADTLEPNFRR